MEVKLLRFSLAQHIQGITQRRIDSQLLRYLTFFSLCYLSLVCALNLWTISFYIPTLKCLRLTGHRCHCSGQDSFKTGGSHRPGGIFEIVTGLLLWLASWFKKKKKDLYLFSSIFVFTNGNKIFEWESQSTVRISL